MSPRPPAPTRAAPPPPSPGALASPGRPVTAAAPALRSPASTWAKKRGKQREPLVVPPVFFDSGRGDGWGPVHDHLLDLFPSRGIKFRFHSPESGSSFLARAPAA